MHAHTFCSLLCVFLIFSRTDALFGYGLIRCQFTSSNDTVYLEQIYFNKVFIGQYNSTLGKVVGYTKYAQELATLLNKNAAFMKQEEKNAETCRTAAPLLQDVISKSIEPYVRLRSAVAVASRHPAMLICSAYSFYPKQIKISWLRNGKAVKSDVTSTDILANGNWLYQIHSHLEYTPIPGEKITCMVEHASFKEAKLYDWDPTSESQKEKIAVGTASLLLGFVFLLGGVIYYWKNSNGSSLVPTDDS